MGRLIVGLQPVREAIRVHGTGIAQVRIQAKGSPRVEALARFASDQGIEVARASRAELDRLAHGVRHQGAAALAPELRLHELADVDAARDTPLVALDGITDPQNFGATIRSVVALGSGALMWAEHHSAPLTAATFRASAGAVEHARLVRVPSLREALVTLRGRGFTTLALDPAGPTELESLDVHGPTALVVGSEDRGVRRSVARACEHRVRLSMSGPLQSLNASVAAAVALHELLRR